MIGEAYVRIPEGKVITRGEPLVLTEKMLTADAKAGYLLSMDGNDFKAKPSDGTAMPLGWLSYEHTHYHVRPVTLDDVFPAGTPVAVAAGGNFEVYAFVTGKADDDVTVTTGTYLADNGNGTLKIYDPKGTVTEGVAANPLPPVAVALESKLIPEGTVVRMTVKSLI